jgi:hypothetical protein
MVEADLFTTYAHPDRKKNWRINKFHQSFWYAAEYQKEILIKLLQQDIIPFEQIVSDTKIWQINAPHNEEEYYRFHDMNQKSIDEIFILPLR